MAVSAALMVLCATKVGVASAAAGAAYVLLVAWTERVYGVPPEQVIGSSIKTRFEMRDGTPVLFRLPDINFIDDKAGKPIGINEHIGRRPIAAFGNSDGDLEMLQYTTLSGGPRFGDVARQVFAKSRLRVGLAFRPFPRLVIVSELDQHPLTFFLQHPIPQAQGAKALRARS